MTKSCNEYLKEDKSNVYPSARQAYKAGQQSKQAEVDELQLKLSEDSRVLHNVIDIERKKCEELQKRIDEALSCADKCTWNIALVELKKILKGGSHES